MGDTAPKARRSFSTLRALSDAESEALLRAIEDEELAKLTARQERRRLVVARWCEGVTAQAIADEVGTSKNSITADVFYLRREGIKLERRPTHRPGAPGSKPRPAQRDTELDDKIVELVAVGLTDAQIGARIGRSKKTVAHRLGQMRKEGRDLPRRRRGRPPASRSPRPGQIALSNGGGRR